MLKQQYFLPVHMLYTQVSKNPCAVPGFFYTFPQLQKPRFFHTVVQTGWISLLSFLPFEFIIGSRWKGWAFDDLTHFFSAEAKVVYGPHIGKLHHLDLKIEGNRQFRVMFILTIHLKGKNWKPGSWQITSNHKTTESGNGWQWQLDHSNFSNCLLQSPNKGRG